MFRKKNEIKAAKKAKANKAYEKCGHTRSYKARNGSTITVICTKNGNAIHIHE